MTTQLLNWIRPALFLIIALVVGCENVDVSTDPSLSAKLASQKRFYVSSEISVVDTERRVSHLHDAEILDIVGEIIASKGYEQVSSPSSADFQVTCQWTYEKVLGSNNVVVGDKTINTNTSYTTFLIVTAGSSDNPEWSANGPVRVPNGNRPYLTKQISAVLASFPSSEAN